MDAKETGDEPEDEPEDESEDESEDEPEDAAPKEPAKPLPPSVERALAKAREAVKADRERKSGRWLAVIPVGVALLLLALLMPRATAPDGVPVPRVDQRVTAKVAAAEDALANEAEAERLPGDVLLVGSTFREFNVAEASDEAPAIALARSRLESVVANARHQKDWERHLHALRAVQTRTFLRAIAAWESGAEPPDFVDAGGGFVKRAEGAGWVEGRRLLLDETQRRVAFKAVWNALTGLAAVPSFASTLDEERALYAFYIQHPRVPENARELVSLRLRDAKTPEACARARIDAERQTAMWQAEKIKRLGAIDPGYPTEYALGIAYFKGGRADLAVEAFGTYIQAHPEGAYALRAKNHLKFVLTAVEP